MLAGDRAPGRRKRVSDAEARDDDAPPLSEVEELARVASAEHERSRKLTWSEALRVSFGLDSLTCPCGGKCRLIAVITQAKVVKKILRHLGLPADVVPKETQPIWRVRGPPGQVFPEDVDETGQDLAIDEDFGIDFVDELPLDDVAAWARGKGAGAEYQGPRGAEGIGRVRRTRPKRGWRKPDRV